jgi:prepilin-type N-terminal cleavage/methylation domain-containing protein
MQQTSSAGLKRSKGSLNSFTLVELLVVIAIIAILAALILAAGEGVLKKAAQARAQSEIEAMKNALTAYKIDNGIYPQSSSITGPPSGTYPLTPSSYLTASETLFQALSGITNFNTDVPQAGVKSYMTFTKKQIGNPAGPSYIQDPWGNSYGYSTGDANLPPTAQALYPYNGSGFFDLWSTGGVSSTALNPTNSWIVNWQ